MEESNFIIENGVLKKHLVQESVIKIPETVSIIGEGAFENENCVEKLIIPDNVKIIEKDAFKGSHIFEIEMGNGVVFIGECAFENLYTGSDINLSAELKYIGKGAFRFVRFYNESHTIRIPSSVIKIEDNAFECSEFSEIILDEGIKEIGMEALSGASIENISIPGSVANINERLFDGCYELKGVKLNNGIKRIKDYAFWGCDALEKIEFPNTLCEVGRGVFENCRKLKKINIISNNDLNIFEYAFENSEIEDIEIIAKKRLYIREYAFAELKMLKHVKIFAADYGNIIIEKGAFQECTSLESVEIVSASKITIGERAFEDCNYLRKLSVVSQHFPTKIEEQAFLNCTSLSDVSLSTDIYLYENAFEGCSKLEKINWIGYFNSIKFLKEGYLLHFTEKEVMDIIKNPEQVELCSDLNIKSAENEKKVDTFDDEEDDDNTFDDDDEEKFETRENDEILKKLEEINQSIKESNQGLSQYNSVDVDELIERLWEIL